MLLPPQHDRQLFVLPFADAGRWDPASLAASVVVMEALEQRRARMVIRHPLLETVLEETETPLVKPGWRPPAGVLVEVRMGEDAYFLRRSIDGRHWIDLEALDADQSLEHLAGALARILPVGERGLSKREDSKAGPSGPALSEVDRVKHDLCLPFDVYRAFGKGLLALPAMSDREDPAPQSSQAGDRNEARLLFEPVFRRSDSLFARGWAAFLRMDRMDTFLERFPPGPLPPQCGRVRAAIARSRVLRFNHRFREAAIDIDPLLEVYPYLPDLQLEAARLLRATRQWEKARHTYRWVLVLAPDWTIASIELATLLMEGGHLEDARSVLLEALDRAWTPELRARVELNIGGLAETSGAWTEALERYDRGLELVMDLQAPTLKGALLHARGRGLHALERDEEAEKALLAAVRIRRQYAFSHVSSRKALAETLYDLSLLQAHRGFFEAAEKEMSEAAAIQRAMREEVFASAYWLDLARAYRHEGEVRRALDLLSRHSSPERLPLDEKAHWDKLFATLLADLERWREALSLFERAALRYAAADDARGEAEAWYNCAEAALHTGVVDKASECLRFARRAALRGGEADWAADIEAEIIRIEGLYPAQEKGSVP